MKQRLLICYDGACQGLLDLLVIVLDAVEMGRCKDLKDLAK